MKNILLLTLLSFTLATQITTREFTINIPVNSENGYINGSWDISEISGIPYGSIEIFPYIQGLSNTNSMYIELSSETSWGEYYCQMDSIDDILVGGCYEEEIDKVIFYINSSVEYSIDHNSTQNLAYIPLRIWVTGAFEEDESDMGDLNDDGNVNIFDVLVLVNIILDGDSGDIFDVMEFIKRV